MKNRLFLMIAVLALASMVLAACGPAPTEAPAEPAEPAAPAATEVLAEPTAAPEPTAVPKVPVASFDGTTLKAESCDYGGYFSSIEATDQYTVTFNLCKTDAAFLSKIAFSPFAIYPSEWLTATAGDEFRSAEGVEKPIGTGPYMVSEWNRGESITFTKNPDYWGEIPLAAETLVFRWSTESAARLLELQSGTVDGFDNVGPDDFATIEADPTLHVQLRPALNTFYLGFTNTYPPFDNLQVRQAVAMGIDRQRIVDNFLPAGSEVATHFTPCAIPNACVGDSWYDFDPVAAKALLAEAGFPDGFDTKLYYRDVVRGYLPQPSVVAQDIQAQLLENLNINAEIEVMESGAFIEASGAGELNGFHLLGWGADYPHVTNFLDYHFGKDQKQFGTTFPEIYDNLIAGGQIGIPADAEQYYVAANNAIKELVPMVVISHAGSAAAYRADVVTPQASPLTTEEFAFSGPGDRDVFVWMQNAEPNTLFCADETDGEGLRACEQFVEGLYGYEINDTATYPKLATACTPNADSTVWVCTLRQGVKFHDGTDFDSADVLATWDMLLNPASPNHKGNTNLWEYAETLWGVMWK